MITAASIVLWLMAIFAFGVFGSSTHDEDKSTSIFWAGFTMLFCVLAAGLQVYAVLT